MGKDQWLFGGRSSSRRATDTTVNYCQRHRPSLPGCMSTLFNFFDFHSSHFTHFVFNKHHTSSFDLSAHLPLQPKASSHGVEAPRNSLELEEASISCLRNEEENLQLQMGVEIKTRNGSKKSKENEQPLPNITDEVAALESPSAKTPNLLARLMGLDILPQNSSSSSATRSDLPESPRVSSSSRPSDVDRHHRRLSLQISLEKENIEICKGTEREDEKVRRNNVALVDITNNNKKRLGFGKQEVCFSPTKVHKSSKKLKKTVADESSSRLGNTQELVIPKKQNLMPMPMPKTKPREGEAFGRPTSNNLLNNLKQSTVFPPKKESSPPAPKVPSEQLCSYPKNRRKSVIRDGRERYTIDSTTTTDGGAAEFRYVKNILTTHCISNWFSPSNPMDPSIILHHQEIAPGAMEDSTQDQWNRRLLLHLVDEVLGEIIMKKSWDVGRRMNAKWELAKEVRERVEEFPSAKCEVLEDIDALIEKDLEKSKLELWRATETKGIVKVVEVHILDSLLQETIVVAVVASLLKRRRF